MKSKTISNKLAILEPSNDCIPVLATDDYKDFRLSDILYHHNAKASAIEPIEHQHWNPESSTVELDIKYAIIPNSIENEIGRQQMPYRFIIEPLCKIGRQCSENITILLQSSMADDLILRYFKELEQPVWVCSEINSNLICIERAI